MFVNSNPRAARSAAGWLPRWRGANVLAFSLQRTSCPELLGPAKYIRETRLKTSHPGVVTGLAYTAAGGEVLYIESARFPGTGQITLTGQIGNVMKEPAQAALPSRAISRTRDPGQS